MSVERFELGYTPYCDEDRMSMISADDGDYVEYHDYQKLEAKLNGLDKLLNDASSALIEADDYGYEDLIDRIENFRSAL